MRQMFQPWYVATVHLVTVLKLPRRREGDRNIPTYNACIESALQTAITSPRRVLDRRAHSLCARVARIVGTAPWLVRARATARLARRGQAPPGEAVPRKDLDGVLVEPTRCYYLLRLRDSTLFCFLK